MSETVSCPHCNGKIVTEARIAGREVGCPHCTGRIIMPNMAQVTPAVIIHPPSEHTAADPLDFLNTATPTTRNGPPPPPPLKTGQKSNSPTSQRPTKKQMSSAERRKLIFAGVFFGFCGLIFVADWFSKKNVVEVPAARGSKSAVTLDTSTTSTSTSHSSHAYQEGYKLGAGLAKRMALPIMTFIQSVGSNWNEGTNATLKMMTQNVVKTYRDFRHNYAQARAAAGDGNEAVRGFEGRFEGFRDMLLELHFVSRAEQLDED